MNNSTTTTTIAQLIRQAWIAEVANTSSKEDLDIFLKTVDSKLNNMTEDERNIALMEWYDNDKELWLEVCTHNDIPMGEELNIQSAETGADRELCFDLEAYEDREFEAWLCLRDLA